MPTPLPLPVVTSQNSFSGTFTGSGTMAASGSVSGVYPGPWFVEEQSLNIEYVRVPRSVAAPTNISLSGPTTATETVHQTVLVAKIQCHVTKKKVFDAFDTSTYLAPQQFEFVPNTEDQFGNTYGTLSGLALGPQGRIITAQPFYRRVPWNELDHSGLLLSGTYGSNNGPSGTVYTETAEVFNCAFSPFLGVSAAGYTTDANFAMAGAMSLGRSLFSPMRHVAAFNGGGQLSDDIWFTNPSYQIYGPYSVEKESDFLVRDFVDHVGSNIAIAYTQPWSGNTFGSFYDAQAPVGGGLSAPQKTTTGICPSYNWNYHDWT